jgi:hypothetical protein
MKPRIGIKLVLSNSLKRRCQGIGQGLQLDNAISVSLRPAENSICTS